MDLFRIATAGSVDDGKSTLIGRLLYETNSLKEDQLQHIEQKSHSKGLSYRDFSLATDGLLTEREQGITIDVSHIYFKTQKRRFIIADSPGHIEYTRNMVTGASNANAAIILLDARKGVVEQTRRHLYITQLLGIQQLIFAINKMDLVDYDQKVFNQIKSEIEPLLNKPKDQAHYLPISALKGDNLITPSKTMDWYSGKSLIEIIETLPLEVNINALGIMQVQYVIRPQLENLHDYRGFAGKIKSGTFKPGDQITVFPSGQKTHIKAIERYGEPLEEVLENDNAAFLLADEVDASRGSVFVRQSEALLPQKEINATVCWMQNEQLEAGKKYWLQQGVQTVLTKVDAIHSKVDLGNGAQLSGQALHLNDIGETALTLAQPILAEAYHHNKALGAFILIDQKTFNTAGVGFIH